MKKLLIGLSVIAVLAISAALVGPIMSQVETPPYETIHSYDSIEVRRYEPQLIASVSVEGPRQEAINKGFRILADYIFGNNISAQDISMTAPVQQQASEEIAMTAPVQQNREGNAWVVEFIMPSKYTLETLPKPNDVRVQIKQAAEKFTLTIRFSGRTNDENLAAQKQILDQFVKDNNVPIMGPATYAFYNPPWTVPFFRRNEISYQIPGERFNTVQKGDN